MKNIFKLFILNSTFILALQIDTKKDSVYFKLDSINITANRFSGNYDKLPISISKVQNEKGEKQLTLNDLLNSSSGVFNQNSNNFAQDLRVSIRGFGARSSFGIRGIKILVDGIPESTPDGQAQVDNIDLGFISNVEIIKGLISSQYGNASGGVISLNSKKINEISLIESRYIMGNYGFKQFQFKIGKKFEDINYLFSFSNNRGTGFREHSSYESYIFNTKTNWFPSKKIKLVFILNYSNSPVAKDPGSLSLENIELKWNGARDKNILFDAGEKVDQSKLAVLMEKKMNQNQKIISKIYYISRNFSNRLPFEEGGQVQFERNFYGISNLISLKTNLFEIPFKLSLGFDIESQIDLRERYNNLNGIRGKKVFKQDEFFLNQAFFTEQKISFSKDFDIFLGFRYDINRIKAIDRYLINGNLAGNRNLFNLSPKLGFVHILKNISIYSNISSNFETPTLNELSNNPNGEVGFNEKLNPQLSKQFEFGLKGFNNLLTYNLALFIIDIKNEFIPYEIERLPGRNFFRNSGRSKRNGFELSFNIDISNTLKFYTSYTFSNFKYINFHLIDRNYDNNYMPGIPKNLFYSQIFSKNKSGFNYKLIFRFNDKIYLDDSNTNFTNSTSILDLRITNDFNFIQNQFKFIFGVNNILNQKYYSNIRINAWGNRFFETAPLRNFYLGTEIKI